MGYALGEEGGGSLGLYVYTGAYDRYRGKAGEVVVDTPAAGGVSAGGQDVDLFDADPTSGSATGRTERGGTRGIGAGVRSGLRGARVLIRFLPPWHVKYRHLITHGTQHRPALPIRVWLEDAYDGKGGRGGEDAYHLAGDPGGLL